MIISKEVI